MNFLNFSHRTPLPSHRVRRTPVLSLRFAAPLLFLLPLGAACGTDSVVEDTPDPPGAFLFDSDWEYVETRLVLGAGGSLPFPNDLGIIEKIRYPEGGAPPTGDALIGSEVIFDATGELLIKPPEFNDFESFGTKFRIVDEQIMRASIRKTIWFKYEYNFDATTGSLIINPEPAAASKVTGLLNDIYARILFSGKLDSAAAKITEALFEDPRVSDAIASFLYDGIRGKLEDIPQQDPEEIARLLAVAILDFLDGQDFAAALEPVIASRLEELTNLDADAVAKEMAANIATKVEAIFSEENIIAAILPKLEDIVARDPAEVASELAQIAFDLISTQLTEERLSKIVESAWREFVTLGQEDIEVVAAELATVISGNWLNAETLSARVLPKVQLIEATDSADIQALADAAVDDLMVLVDELNARIDGLELSPPWSLVRIAVRQAFAAAKDTIAVDGSQVVADNIGQMLEAQFFSYEAIEGATTQALLRLQEVEPADAGEILGAWLVALVDANADAIVDSLSARLEVLIENLDADEASAIIAGVLHTKVTERLDEASLYAALFPLIEKLTQIDPDAGAAFLVKLMQDANIIGSSIIEDKLTEAILAILEELLPLDKDALAERLVTLIVESSFVAEIKPERVENILKFLLYRRVLERGQNLAAIDRLEIELRQAN